MSTKKTYRSMYYILIGLFLFIFTTGVPVQAAQVKIIFPKHVSATHPATLNAKRFGKIVNKLSSGNINVKVYPGDQYASAKQALRFLTQGSVQMMNPPNGFFSGYSPTTELIEVPFAFKTRVAFYNFLYGKGGNKILQSLEKSNMIGITFSDEGPWVIATKNRLIRTPGDFKGLKIRTSGHIMMEKEFHLLGASTVSLELGQVYSAAQQGVVNGVATTLAAYVHQHLYEVLPYATLWPARVAYIWVVSKTWFDGLNPYYRYIIKTTAKEEALKYDVKIWQQKNKYIRIIKRNGGKFHELSLKEAKAVRLKIAPLYNKIKKRFGSLYNTILQQ